MTINGFQFSPQMLVMVTIVLYANCAAESVFSERDVQQRTAANVSNGLQNVKNCCNTITEYDDGGATDSQPDNFSCPDMAATFGFLISNDDIEETSIRKSLDLKDALAVSCFTSTNLSNEPNLPIESNLINAPISENATSSELTTKHVMIYSTDQTHNETVQINNAAVTIPPETYKIVTELIKRKIPVNFPAKKLKIETNIGINSPESHCATGYTGSMGAIAQNIKHVDYRICYNSEVMQRPLNNDFIAHRKLKPSEEFFTVLKGTRANIKCDQTDRDDSTKPFVARSFRSYRDRLIDMMDKGLSLAVIARYNTRLLDRLRLFNVWLELNDTNTQEYNICDLYYIATNKKNLASANTHFKNTLSKVLLPCHIKDIHVSADYVTKNAELKAKQLTRPSFAVKSNLNGSIGLTHVSSFLKKLLNQQNTSTEKFTAFDFYTLVMAKVLHASDNGKYTFNHHIKNLLHFMPELLVYAEHRIYLEKQNPTNIDLAKETSKFRDVLVAYAKCHDLDNIKQIRRLEYRVRVFRVLTCKMITNAIINPNKKIHLYELAMKLRYNGYKNGYNEKAANVFFILAFTAKDMYISGFLERVYTFEKLALSYNDILEELAKECGTNREYACILHMLVKYYDLIDLCSSRKLMIYSWQTKTLVITQNEKCTHIELLNRKSPLIILYDELMRDTI